MKELQLNDGHRLPLIGLGTYKLNGKAGVDAIITAINSGYRLIDTAYNYENEGTVGKAIQESGLDRHQLYITSKLPGRYHQKEAARTAIEESLYRAGLDYFDLYLIHWPNPIEDHYVEAWSALIEAKNDGLIRSIGVSNFLPEHIDRLYNETGVYPAVNQLEFHPYFNQNEVLAYHKDRGIVVEAWSPLGRASNVLNDEKLHQLSSKYDKTISQIILRWLIQLGVVPIPKSSSAKRQQENMNVFDFELSHEDIQAINALTKEDGRLNDQDPSVYQEF